MSELAQASQRSQDDLVGRLHKSNHELTNLLLKQRAFFKLSLSRLQTSLNRRLSEITETSDLLKRRQVANRIASELKNVLVVQQKMALKRQLGKLDAEYNALKAKFEKEVRFIEFP